MKVIGITAMDPNGVIGNNDGGKYTIPWHISEDFKFFKRTTLNHSILMGRKTWESIGSKPLPKRRNIVISTQMDDVEGVDIIRYPMQYCMLDFEKDQDLFIIGGSKVYEIFINKMDELYVSQIKKEYEGNIKFPIINYDKFFDKMDIIHEDEEFYVERYY